MKKITLLKVEDNLLIGSEKEEDLQKLKRELNLNELPIITFKKEPLEELKAASPLIIFYHNQYFFNLEKETVPLLKNYYFLEYREKDFLFSFSELVNFLKKRYRIEKNFKEPFKIKNWTHIKIDNDIYLLKRGSLSLYTLEKKLKRRIKLSKDYWFNILVVCTGNTCRSPMAKGILETYLKDYPVFIYSAGIKALNNSPPSSYAEKALKEIGIDISGHLAKSISEEMVKEADLVLCAEKNHYYYLNSLFAEYEDKIFLIKGYPQKNGEDLFDPIGLDYDAFLKVRDELMVALKNVSEDIKERFN
uniref:Phosphotyrosine protein phosphatase I domain-containing protein n=1 Tax=candidate division WOR-3 bacterium TaxID=2052148 RepID=A0A7V5XZD9_UNCW3